MHHHFPSMALKCQLTWTNNALEECAAPWQTLLGAMDPAYCVLVILTIWLEISLSTIQHAWFSPYIFACGTRRRRHRYKALCKKYSKASFLMQTMRSTCRYPCTACILPLCIVAATMLDLTQTFPSETCKVLPVQVGDTVTDTETGTQHFYD
jgi:hypothetical protein